MQTDETDASKSSSSDIDSVLKKSGVEILGGEEEVVMGPHDSAEKLTRDFETELNKSSSISSKDTDTSSLSESIKHLEEAHVKLTREEKILGDETAKDIEELKKTKAIIEEKINKLKEIEQKEKTIQAELTEAKELEAREKKLKEDVDRISHDTQ